MDNQKCVPQEEFDALWKSHERELNRLWLYGFVLSCIQIVQGFAIWGWI